MTIYAAFFCNLLISNSHGTLSNAFSKSMKHANSFFPLVNLLCINECKIIKLSLVLFPFRNPICSLAKILLLIV